MKVDLKDASQVVHSVASMVDVKVDPKDAWLVGHWVAWWATSMVVWMVGKKVWKGHSKAALMAHSKVVEWA